MVVGRSGMGQGPQNPCILFLQLRTNGLIEPAPSMVLVPVHRPTGEECRPGGCCSVIQWWEYRCKGKNVGGGS